MKHMFLRWYRNWTNPNPMPGQTWMLEGMGVVVIREVNVAALSWIFGGVVKFYCNGRDYKWTLLAFRSHAMVPMISDLSRSEP